MTGHGNVVFNSSEAENLRTYLLAGGFLHIDDNYGLNQFIRLEIKKVFPNLDFVELPFTHPIYHQKYNFPEGLATFFATLESPSVGMPLAFAIAIHNIPDRVIWVADDDQLIAIKH
jgi:hypothetical protein